MLLRNGYEMHRHPTASRARSSFIRYFSTEKTVMKDIRKRTNVMDFHCVSARVKESTAFEFSSLFFGCWWVCFIAHDVNAREGLFGCGYGSGVIPTLSVEDCFDEAEGPADRHRMMLVLDPDYCRVFVRLGCDCSGESVPAWQAVN